MADHFLFFLIDNERYAVDGQIRFAEGTGDDRSEWSMHVLRHEKTGEICYLEEGQPNVTYAYWAPEEAINAKKYRVDTYEKHAVEVLLGDEIFEKSSLDLEYGAIADDKLSEQAWGMFEGSTDVLVVNNKELLFSRRLVKDRENIYYSDIFPAEKLQRVAHPRRTPPAFGELLFLIAVVALSITGIIDIFVLMKPMGPDFSSIFLYGGFIAWAIWVFVERTSWLYATARFWAAALGIYLCTVLLDNHIHHTHPTSYRAFVLWHMLIPVLIVGGLRLFWRKGFAILSRSALTAAFWVVLLHGFGILIVSCEDDAWWGGDFFWYLGAMPYGHAYALLFVIILLAKARDYLYVPMDKQGFVKQIHKLQEILQRTPSTNPEQNKADAEICDDLADAIEISSTPEVAALAPLLEQFRLLTQIIEAYATKKEEITEDPDVHEDLAVLCTDLQEIIDCLDSQQPVHSLRLSPFLRAVTLEVTIPKA